MPSDSKSLWTKSVSLDCSTAVSDPRQVRDNEESLVSFTTQVARSLEDLEDIVKALHGKGPLSMPAGLQRDLDRMQSGSVHRLFAPHLTDPPSLAQSTEALLLLASARPRGDESRLRRLLSKGKQLKHRNGVSGILHRVDDDMQALLGRFSVSPRL
jgi:hypothetical protein